MGLDGNYLRISRSEYENFQAGPQPLENVLLQLYGAEPNPADASAEVWDKLWERLTESDHYLHLMKEWHALHFLLTGRAKGGEPPLRDVVLGAEAEFARLDVSGELPPRAISPAAVKAASEAMNVITEDELRLNFDPEQMNTGDVYGNGSSKWREEDFEEILPTFEIVRDFFNTAAQVDEAILFWL